MTDYVDRCTCGNFVTQKELGEGYCSECERGTGRFDKELYEATKQAMLVAGAPEEVAEKAAKVIASDDSNKPNLGRSKVDQEIVSQAWNYLVKPKN